MLRNRKIPYAKRSYCCNSIGVENLALAGLTAQADKENMRNLC